MTTPRFAFQTRYQYDVDRNYKGTVARPGEPTVIEHGYAGETLVPGDAVLFNYTNTERNFHKPAAGELLNVMGMVLYNEGTVPTDNAGTVSFADGDPVRVGIVGAFYAEAGSAIEYLNQVTWNIADGVWDLLTEPVTYALAHRNPAFCADRVVADGELFVVRFHGPIR